MTKYYKRVVKTYTTTLEVWMTRSGGAQITKYGKKASEARIGDATVEVVEDFTELTEHELLLSGHATSSSIDDC